ncbi:glycosyltransferase family 2 protein [Curtobacterium sp. MCBD17_034]|uniref:glycosyltransferase family 2 protein n=1 Tax=unclassified Curtobacterium TaxID=257496 RepID=UPI000DA84C4D|nr:MULTISPECIES: glycosyltransferase family 2 protein [unclassified Curtobacterium]PZE26416.1 glycosyltransferase family 2 protein [Curtobacterium sp. MCBD17_028]PZE75075.1 glycosyltransferase family 2 protein [Curtobacterium sp. MCBD17_019]PZF58509.1 glycosyltransferase family 2 protein [Curtobacterium sp. MCBD17_034]PZF64441.1 glycosyltransferase family 2 protein [Curtobacterium sp. MCBD17_013]PZM34498.1 glycosyltransferase family 2 protein [Curtobacterium sp. MCBD17_031]
MKLFVQIPALNEEATIASVIDSIPREIPGIDEVELLVIDDGCSDRTVEVAREHGVKHFVHHTTNMGLARSFRDGVDYALLHGADIVVNTDGDNQYPQAMITELVQPILRREADIVIGDRQTRTIEHFSAFKKSMQQFGSWVASRAAGLDLPDAASGFRAYSKYSLIRLNIVTRFSYCMETIVQAGYKRLAIASVPITTNPKTRESRLFSNIWQHMFQSGSAIARVYLMYRPMALFAWISVLLAVCGLIPFVRYLVLLAVDGGGNHLQSLILGVVLVITALLSIVIGVVADLTRLNRTLQEETLDLQKLARYGD